MPGGEVIKCTLSSSCKRSATRGIQCSVLAPGSRRVKICLWQVKQSRCHSGLDPESRRRPGESREPIYSNITGCRIKPGMTFKERIKIDIFIQST
ncbi:MAG: hypothetical protein JW914_01505 [Syntrophaceae bacterium]|nr:hypothetical protein [Syntrophaceae bacterium]